MKKYLCFLVLLSLLPNVYADNDKGKKKKPQQLQLTGKKSGAAPGGIHLPGTSHTGSAPHNSGQAHANSVPGNRSPNSAIRSRSPQLGSNSAPGKVSSTGSSRTNPLLRHGGSTNAADKANPLKQKNHQAAANNPMLRKSTPNAAGQRDTRQLNRNPHSGNMAAARNAQVNRVASRTVVRGARANYHVRPYREVFHTYHPIHHNRVWYTSHYDRVVIVGGGYYYWDAGYWYPAWGYDPVYTGYVYDGPIYSYDNLTPDQVIVNVQTELQDQGYYAGEIDGQLGPQTRDALGAFQADHNLETTSAVDEPTVEALGLAESA